MQWRFHRSSYLLHHFWALFPGKWKWKHRSIMRVHPQYDNIIKRRKCYQNIRNTFVSDCRLREGVGGGKRDRRRRTSLRSIVSSPPFNSDFVTNSSKGNLESHLTRVFPLYVIIFYSRPRLILWKIVSPIPEPTSPSKKKTHLKLKILGALCNQTVDLRTDSKILYYCILKLKYSPSILKHNKG